MNMVRRTRPAPLKLLIVGCGNVARIHARRLVDDGRGVVAGCCDPDRAAAWALARKFSREPVVFPSVSAALNDAKFDGAIICTPTTQHFEQVRELRNHGVPVLCEKPLADTRDRIAELVRSSRSGPLLSIAYQRRYSSAFRTLRREVLSGRHGPVRSVVVQNCERWAQTIDGTWRNDPVQNPGGFLGDAGSHKVDMVFFVTALPPLVVSARSQKRRWKVDVISQISAVLEGGVPLAMTFVGDAHHFSEEFWFHCAEADVFLRNGRVFIARDDKVAPVADAEAETNPDSAFIDCLREGASNLAPAGIALPVWDFMSAALESAQRVKEVHLTGRWLAVDLGM